MDELLDVIAKVLGFFFTRLGYFLFGIPKDEKEEVVYLYNRGATFLIGCITLGFLIGLAVFATHGSRENMQEFYLRILCLGGSAFWGTIFTGWRIHGNLERSQEREDLSSLVRNLSQLKAEQALRELESASIIELRNTTYPGHEFFGHSSPESRFFSTRILLDPTRCTAQTLARIISMAAKNRWFGEERTGHEIAALLCERVKGVSRENTRDRAADFLIWSTDGKSHETTREYLLEALSSWHLEHKFAR